MSTRVDESGSYPADPAAVFALITDPAFRADSARAQGASGVEVDVATSGDDTVITIIRDEPAEGVPDFIAKFIGKTVKVKQVETWGPTDTDGGRSAAVRVKIIGQPAELTGTATLTPGSDTTTLALGGEVSVSVPFLGKKIEPEIAKVISASLRHDIEAGVARLG